MNEADTAEHAFLDGRLLLREPRRGHRSGTDAVLLAAASRVVEGQHVVDVGAGAGAAALAILCRVEGTTATLVENDPTMAELARRNIATNGFTGRATVAEFDLFDRPAGHAAKLGEADVIVSNPPFYLDAEVRASPDRQRARSHVLSGRDHGDWLREILVRAAPKGRVVLIHRPEAVPALLKAAEGRAGVALRSIHPKPNQPAHRTLLVFRPGRRAPFAIEPPLVLHEEEGCFTPFSEALHRGRAWL